MPNTFSGAYLREPSDFASVADEQILIQGADDPDQPDALHVYSFAELLTAPPPPPDPDSPYTKIVGVLNSIIAKQEALVDSYVRAGGYAIPALDSLAVPNQVITALAAEMVVISLRERRQLITPEGAAAARSRVASTLRDIAKGVLEIDVARDEGPSASQSVYAVSSSDRVFSRDKLGDF